MTATTTGEVRQRLADMFAEVSGITAAYARVPKNFGRERLPVAVVFVPRGDYDTAVVGSGRVRQTRTYEVTVFVADFGGIEGAGEETAEELIDAVSNHFLLRPGGETYSADGFIQDVVFQGDNGIQVGAFPRGGNEYISVTFRLQVQTMHTLLNRY